jgi:uncharacterized protein
MTAALHGHGIGLRPVHYGEVIEHGVRDVCWIEVCSENFFVPGGRPWAALARARAEAPVAIHGVSMSLGGIDPLSERYLASLEGLVRRIEPAAISDHLCWGGVGGRYGHDLYPLPYTEEALAHVAARIVRVQDRLGRRILVENVSSYVEFAQSAMPEWEFLREVARRADCGILLDVNNIYVSGRNHGFDPEVYVDAIPAERIGYVHVAGHTDKGWFLLDSHVGPVPDPVWRLWQRLVRRIGPRPSLVEWDEATPDLETVATEARIAARLEEEALGA